MTERTPGFKHDEQFPLLKGEMDAKEGSSVGKKGKTPGSGNGWKVNCVKTAPFYNRWPELMWACWISISFFGLYLLFIYVTTCLRGEPLRLTLQTVETVSKPGSDVYFHHIVPKDSVVPFSIYSNYLSTLAKDYPKLRINVFFLTDDFTPANIKHSKLFALLNNKKIDLKTNMDQFDISVLENALKAYGNLRVTFMSIKSFMDTTPLKYRWRLIPADNLAFYARVYSVWEHGGIALDLTAFNNQFSIGENMDKRISMLLKQHNDGIDYNMYGEILESEPERDELGMIKFLSNFMNDLFTIMQSPQQVNIEEEKSHIRKHRNKRNAKDALPTTMDTEQATTDSTETTTFYPTTYRTTPTVHENGTENAFKTEAVHQVAEIKTNDTTNSTLADEQNNATDHRRQLVMLYKVFLFPEKKPEPLGYPSDGFAYGKPAVKSRPAKSLLTIDSEGLFLATPTRQHPFLCQIMSAATQRMDPRSAIDTAYMEQCSNMLRNDIYCKSIYVKQFLMTTVFF